MVLRDKLLERRGLGLIHPWFAFIYLVMALILTMCSVNPILIFLSLFAASLYEIHLQGWMKYIRYIPWLILIIIITTIGNMLISHNGMHVLFLVNDNRITVEAGMYGAVFGLMFAAAFLWCDIMQRMITGEKLTFMFGSFAPSLGLVISMTLHYIPMLRRRMNIVHNAQAGMGRNVRKGPFKRARQWGKEFSIVISWTLENAIDTSQTMTAMGYGVGRRSSYSNYRIKTSDVIFLIVIVGLMVPSFIVTVFSGYKVYYYPTFGMMGDIYEMLILSIFYLAYMLVPVLASRILGWNSK